jgi:hypothetical protein
MGERPLQPIKFGHVRRSGGHDSLFFKHSEGLATTLVAKDRVLAHNPVGALQLADTYFQRVWGPNRPARLPAQPAEGRRRDQ